MHPNGAFRFDGDAAMLAFAGERGFAHIFAATPDGPMVVHAPIVPAAKAFRFHVARANSLTPYLDGARVLLSVAGSDGYVSPSWYPDPVNQVPTWNYVAVEIVGIARLLDEDGLVEQLDTLAAIHEPRVAPYAPWNRDKMDDARFRSMLRAIAGFEVTVESVRGTAKLSQHRPAAETARVLAALERSGNAALAQAMAGGAAR